MDDDEPTTVKEAMQRPDSKQYMESLHKELNGHYENNTWVPCDLPPGVIPISTKIVWVKKLQPDGSMMHKARVVCRGFSQVAGENFDWENTFAPVLKTATLKWLFSLVAEYDLEITTSDVTQAFLQADLQSADDGHLMDIVIELPDGCEYVCPVTGRKMKHGRLQKAMYGLKQASNRWNRTFHEYLLKIGFKQHALDPCLYTMVRDGKILMLGIYVDDCVKITNCPALRKIVDGLLEAKFKIKHQGIMEEFLGMECGWKYDSNGVKYFSVSQEKYIDKILARYEMTDCNEKLTPSNTSGKPWDIYPHPNPNPVEENDPARVSLYRSIVGACIHPSVLTRPDLAYPCSACGQFLSNPNEQHMTAAMRILRYIKQTKHYSLKYYKSGNTGAQDIR